jgi:hypothetical protein
MKLKLFIQILLFALFSYGYSVTPIPFSGKIAVNGENFTGSAKFSFSIVDSNGVEKWRHAKDTRSMIENVVSRGRYLILLGGQGMNPLPADLFLNTPSLFLRVNVDLLDGNGKRLMKPDQQITASPYALSAELANLAKRAEVSNRVIDGAITAAMLDQNLLEDLNRSVLPGSIKKEDLSDDILNILDNSLNQHLSPKVIKQPSNITPKEGEDVNYSIAVSGANLNYQWFKDGQLLAGQTNEVLKIDNYIPANADGLYTLKVSNEFGSVETNDFRIGVPIDYKQIDIDFFPTDAVATVDQGWFVCGYNQEYNTVVSRFNSTGSKEWSKGLTTGGKINWWPSISASGDGGVAILTSSDSNKSAYKSQDSLGGTDFWLIRMDANGEIIWDKTYGSGGDDWANHIVKTGKNGFLLVGNSDPNVSSSGVSISSENYGRVIHVDENGKVLWEFSKSWGYYDLLLDAELGEDDTYIINLMQSIDTTYSEQWFIKINDFGELVWEINLEPEQNAKTPLASIGGMTSFENSYFAVSDFYDSFGVEGNTSLIKFDENGEKLWEKILGRSLPYSAWTVFHDIIPYRDSMLVSTISEEHNTNKILKIDGNGNTVWEKPIPFQFLWGKIVLSQDSLSALMFDVLGEQKSMLRLDLSKDSSNSQGLSGDSSSSGNQVVHGDYFTHSEIKDGSVTLAKLSQRVAEELQRPLGPDDINQTLLELITALPKENSISNGMLGEDVFEEFVNVSDTWNDLSIGGNKDDYLSSIMPTEDGGYVLFGHTDSDQGGDKTAPWFGSNDGWVVKVDRRGHIVWDKTFGGTHVDKTDIRGLGQILPTKDCGFVIGLTSSSKISGNKEELGFGGFDYWIIKMDRDGNILWSEVFGGASNESLYSIFPAGDGSFLLIGSSQSQKSGNKSEDNFGTFTFNTYPSDAWVVKIDENGTKLWDKVYGGTATDTLTSAVKAGDGGYLLIGTSSSDSGGNKSSNKKGFFHGWVVKIDENGTKLWDESFGGSSLDQLTTGYELSDGFLLGGHSLSATDENKTSPNYGGFDYWLVKIDHDGNKVWENSYGGSGYDSLSQITKSSEGNFLIGGRSNSGLSGNKTLNGFGDYDFWVVELDRNGTKLNENVYGGTGSDYISSLHPTNNGGYIIGGYTNSSADGNKRSSAKGGYDFWLIKVDQQKELPGFDASMLKEKSVTPSILSESIQKYLRPEITMQPQYPGLILTGQSATLTSQAEGKFLEYQWYRNGIKLSGKTTAVLEISNFSQSSNDGNYTLNVKNDFGVVESTTVPLRAYNGDKVWEGGYGAQIHYTADGGYLMTRNTTTDDMGLQLTVSKVSADGVSKIWENSFGGSSNDGCLEIVPTSDGGFLLVGTSSSPADGNKSSSNFGSQDFWAVKIDENGTKLWDKSYGGNMEDTCEGAIAVSSGGYLLFGGSMSGNNGNKTAGKLHLYKEYWAVRIDENGTIIWDKSFGSDDHDTCVDSIETSDGGFLLAGYYHANQINGDISEQPRNDPTVTSKMTDAWIIKVDENGTKLWDKRYGGDYYDITKSISPTADGGFILGCESYSDASGDKSETFVGSGRNYDFWVLKLDENGTKLWDKTVGGDNEERLQQVIVLDDGSSVIFGSSRSEISGDQSQLSRGGNDYWVVKLDENGTKLWDKRYGGNNSDSLNSASISHDNNGFWLIGGTGSDSSGDKTEPGYGTWVVRLDSDGNK